MVTLTRNNSRHYVIADFIDNEALFQVQPPAFECSICCVITPTKLINSIQRSTFGSRISEIPTATLSNVPIHTIAKRNPELADMDTKKYNTCCGNSLCIGCWSKITGWVDVGGVHYGVSRLTIERKCPFCNSDHGQKTTEDRVAEIMSRVAVSDASAMCALANLYHHGLGGFQEDRTMALELYNSSADHGFNDAHVKLGNIYYNEGDLEKAKHHYGAAAIAGHELARFYLGNIEMKYEHWENALKHWKIAASDGEYQSMNKLSILYHLNRNLDGQLEVLF
jgi:hypothetical protein